MQTDVYRGLYEIGRGMNETLEVAELFDITAKFVIDKLNFEKCLIFKHDDYNGWFKIDKAVGYDTPKEKMILKIINLLLSGEVIEYLRVNDDPIIHTQLNPDEKVQKLANSLFLSEAYFELFGGDVDIPYGLVVVGNGFDNLKTHSRIFSDEMIMLALGNFTIQLSNSINNSIFYKAWNDEKKGLEKKIEERTKELSNMLDRTMEAIGIYENHTLVETNDAAVEIYGYDTKEQMVGKNALEFIAVSSRRMVVRYMREEQHKPYEAMAIRADGSEFPVLVKTNHYIRDNKMIGIVSVLDLTSIKENEQQLILAKQKAEEATQIKSNFLANMSHEIRTPMNGIIGMTKLMEKTILGDKQKHYVEVINSSANSLLSIINDILDFSKIEAKKLEIDKVDFNLLNLISNIKNIIEFKAQEKSIEFEIIYDKNNINLYGDSLRISQVLINLLNNAIKFTDKGYVKLIISHANNDFTFEIKDSGVGIAKNQQEQLFNSFTQADASTTRKHGGTGLGLSISKELVKLMGGRIVLDSQEGVGSSFSFSINLEPSLSKLEDKPKNTATIEELYQLNNSQILLVEDNLTNQEIIIGLLQGSGINISIANNGVEAVDMFKANKDKYELILMDLQMPIMGGIEATKIIKEMDSDIPIVALTANAMKEDVQKTKEIGMNEHLNKPIDVEKLYEVFLKYISKKSEKSEIVVDEYLDIELPEFNKIDTKKALKLLGGNKKLYLKILKDFYQNYKDLKFENLNDDEFKIAIHTLKGLSANIGATDLHLITKELDESKNKTHMPRVYEELGVLIDELKVVDEDNKFDIKVKETVSYDKIDKLFLELKDSAKTSRPKECLIVIDKLQGYRLNSKDKELFSSVKRLIKVYKFKEVLEILRDR